MDLSSLLGYAAATFEPLGVVGEAAEPTKADKTTLTVDEKSIG